MVEVNGTTYFLENLRTECGIPGSFKHKGTVYFPQSIERAPAALTSVKPEVNTIPGSYVKNGTTFFVLQEELMRARSPPTPALTNASSLASSNPSSSEPSPDSANYDLPVKGAIDASVMEYMEGAVYMGRRRSAY